MTILHQPREVISYPACFVCGTANPAGLHLRFLWDGAVCRTSYTADIERVGYHDLLHGGITATILDEVMIKAILASDVIAVTTKIMVEYKAPVTLGEAVSFEGWIVRSQKRLHTTAGRAILADGRVAASATGEYLAVRDKGFLDQLSTRLAK